MSGDMLGVAVRKLVTLPAQVLGLVCDLLEKLSDPEWVQATKRYLRKENPWESAKQLGLKYLKLVADNITIAQDEFLKTFFVENGPVRLWFGDNFKNWILSAIPEEVPAFQGALMKTELTKSLYDSEILAELGQPEPFTVSEFAAIIRHLILRQPQGEDGLLPTNGYANIFYVKFGDGRVVAVYVHWDSGLAEWRLDAHGLGGRGWSGGCCVFSRSIPVDTGW